MKKKSFFSKRQNIRSNDSIKKMIGGQDADPREYPWQAMVVLTTYNTTTYKYRYFYKCGGTLISDQWVLTSHHCLDNSNPIWPGGEITVVLGGYVFPPNYQTGNEVTEVFGLEKVVGVEKIVRHPYGGLLAYDIALLKMDSKITFRRNIFPACVPGPDYNLDDYIHKYVYATGWGFTKTVPTRTLPRVLQELKLSIHDRANCHTFLKTGCSAGNMLAITSIF